MKKELEFLQKGQLKLFNNSSIVSIYSNNSIDTNDTIKNKRKTLEVFTLVIYNITKVKIF